MIRNCLITLTAIATVVLTSCSSPETKPRAGGGIDEVCFIQDIRLASDTSYAIIKDRLVEHYGPFYFEEPTFDLLEIDYGNLTGMFRAHRNLIFVGVLDINSTYNETLKMLIGEEGVEKVMSGEVVTAERRDLWATGQGIMAIAAPDKETLVNALPVALERVVSRIQGTEFEKLKKHVYATGENLSYKNELLDMHDISMRIPNDYKRHEKSNGNFLWYRRSTVDLTASVMVMHHPYRRSLEVTPYYAIFLRDSLGKKYERTQVRGAYMTTEKLVYPIRDTISVDGKFAIRTQGLWRTEHDFMGGPFVNYLIYDDDRNRIVFAEGYIYNPDVPTGGRRRMIREMETIISTLSFPEEGTTTTAETRIP